MVPDDDFAMWTGHTAGFNQDEAKATMTDWQQETSSRYMFRDGPGQRHAILWLTLFSRPARPAMRGRRCVWSDEEEA